MENTITISKEEYDELMTVKCMNTVLLNSLFMSSTLSYNGKELSFGGADDILRCLYPERYAETLKERLA